MRAVLGCHLGDSAFALRGASHAVKFLRSQFNLHTLIEIGFYHTLSLCSESARAGLTDKIKLLWLALRNVRKLAGYAKAAPRNYGSRHLLARAALQGALGRRRATKRDLESALVLALRHATHNVAGLAYEQLALWLQRHGREQDRRQALRDARDAYRRWGAAACVARLDRMLSAESEAS